MSDQLPEDVFPRAVTTPQGAAPDDERPILTVDGLKAAGRAFANDLTGVGIEQLYGVTDGKAVGTYVEAAFNVFVETRFSHMSGNAASGIDFPDINVDLKVTSIRQPQSSCPFRDPAQKVYGLGYHLLVMVYEKVDDHEGRKAAFNFKNVIFIHNEFTADHQTTQGIREILDRDGNVDDIDAFLEERRLPLEEIGRRQLAGRILEDPPRLGYLTISNALQWRLQYNRAINFAGGGYEGLEDVIA